MPPNTARQHNNLLTEYLTTREFSESLIQDLSAEDCSLQAMADTSPPKWHLAHTTWFFETFILLKSSLAYQPFHPQFQYLFNSYYNAVGEQFSRPNRHLLSRPSLEEVKAYRAYVDSAMAELLSRADHGFGDLVTLGINHEQQHQELLLMDIKYSFYENPLLPAVQPNETWQSAPQVSPVEFETFDGGLFTLGASAGGFSYDNETPQHQVFVAPFKFAKRLVSNGDFLAFMEDGGYAAAALWLSDGWSWLQQQTNGKPDQAKPHYWFKQDNTWYEFTLQGPKPLDLNRPVCHLNLYEADAIARWMDARLPSEQEWETAASFQVEDGCSNGHFSDASQWHPKGLDEQGRISQLFGELWEWTSSAYAPYPGFKTPEGAVGEYNGKFMCNQMVLRGGSCVTPKGHIRASYRNFFYPKDQWPFTGVRLAKDA